MTPLAINRRHFFSRTSHGIGMAALASLLPSRSPGAEANQDAPGPHGTLGKPHFN